LLDALSKQDEAGAVAVMRRHLERSRHVWGEGDHTAHT
jgi:DNA-binding FadR family transcriptional regulator